jgi:hypothetical protein
MVAADDLDLFAPPERIVEVHRAPARDHENMADASAGEGLRNVVGYTNHSSLRFRQWFCIFMHEGRRVAGTHKPTRRASTLEACIQRHRSRS